MNPLLDLYYAVVPGFEILKEPSRKSKGAAGIDVHVPKINEEFKKAFALMNDNTRAARINEKNQILINPYFSALIPSGLYFNIPADTYLDVATKSGAFKRTGLKVGSHVIDSDYQGQIFISLFNTSRLVVALEEGEAIAQLIHKKYIHSLLFKAENPEVLFTVNTNRGDKGFGSTDEAPHD